jgi:hypothetical protein
MTTLFSEEQYPGQTDGGSIMQAPSSAAPDEQFPGETAHGGSIGPTVAPPGIGLSQPARSRDPVSEAYSKMSGPQEFFTRLGEFGAGVTGQSSPLQARLEAQRRNKLAKIAEVKETTSALEHGVKLAQGMEGDARTSFIDATPRPWTRWTRARERPSRWPLIVRTSSRTSGIMPYLPEPMQVSGEDGPAGPSQDLGTAEGIKAIDEAKSQFNLRTATQKAQG